MCRKRFKDGINSFVIKAYFDESVGTYSKKIQPLKRRDLRSLQAEDGARIYNHFLEILRHNTVSDKGNAFNKIFNLFLCKILDEDRPDDELLDFQWIDGVDDEEKLLGRLNSLYKKGMRNYLNKEVTDYSADEIDLGGEEDRIRTIINELRLYKNQGIRVH